MLYQNVTIYITISSFFLKKCSQIGVIFSIPGCFEMTYCDVFVSKTKGSNKEYNREKKPSYKIFSFFS